VASENLRVFGKQTVLRFSAGFCAETTGLRSTESKARQPAGLPTSFLQPFFFLGKKKVDRSPFFKRLFLKALSVRKQKYFYRKQQNRRKPKFPPIFLFPELPLR
jgi:hypothetical protein